MPITFCKNRRHAFSAGGSGCGRFGGRQPGTEAGMRRVILGGLTTEVVGLLSRLPHELPEKVRRPVPPDTIDPLHGVQARANGAERTERLRRWVGAKERAREIGKANARCRNPLLPGR